MISEGQRLQYLEAMGIKAWISLERANASVFKVSALQQGAQSNPGYPTEKTTDSSPTAITDQQFGAQAAVGPACYEIGPGSGQTLLLCARREDTALPVANDIARCLDQAPVWGWLAQNSNAMESAPADSAHTGLSLERAIKEHMFTRVLLFSNESSAHLAGKDLVLGSARIIHAPALADLASTPAHKRTLWLQLTANGWCAPKAERDA